MAGLKARHPQAVRDPGAPPGPRSAGGARSLPSWSRGGPGSGSNHDDERLGVAWMGSGSPAFFLATGFRSFPVADGRDRLCSIRVTVASFLVLGSGMRRSCRGSRWPPGYSRRRWTGSSYRAGVGDGAWRAPVFIERFRRWGGEGVPLADLDVATAFLPIRPTPAARSAPTCANARSRPPSPNPPTRRRTGCGEAAPAGGHPGSTPKPTSSATLSNARSTSSRPIGRWPPATTNATTRSAEPSTSPRSGSGSATPSHDPRDRLQPVAATGRCTGTQLLRGLRKPALQRG